jgi:hypothetical protein
VYSYFNDEASVLCAFDYVILHCSTATQMPKVLPMYHASEQLDRRKSIDLFVA